MNIPGYADLTPIAQGGFASVFRARQLAFDREVAVKVLTVSLGDGRDRRRFERECVLTGRLTGHPSIVTILDSGFTDHGQPYLTTPFYHAGSLAEHLRDKGPFSTTDTLRIGVAVAGALEMAHRNGILHRDVKPGNVLLSAYGEPALTDFGIAALVQGGVTGTQVTQAFTIDHAPPEVLEGGAATVCADIYALGSTLWTLLAGQAPFAGGDPGLLPRARKVQHDPVPPIGRADVPPALEAALAKAMAKRPEDRYQTAAELGQALQQVQRDCGEPVTALHADAPLRTPPPPRPPETEPTRALPSVPREAALAALAVPAVASAAAPSRPRWRGGDSGGYAPPAPPPGDDIAVMPDPEPPQPPAPAPPAAPTAAAPVAAPAEPAPVRAAPERAPARRPPALVAALVVLVLLVAAVWLMARRSGDTTITTPNPAEQAQSTTAAPTTAAPTTAAPVTTAAPAPSTGAPTSPPTTAPPPTTARPAPTTAAPSGPGPIVDPGASPAVRTAAATAQQAGSALANADWASVRSLIPSLAGRSDGSLDDGWGRLDEVTMVVTDSKEQNGPVVLRLGEVAHERNLDDSRRTTLYCATWTMADGHVVGMADQQTIEPAPWQPGWADPATAVDLLRSRCRKL